MKQTKLFKNNKNDREQLFTMLYSLSDDAEIEIAKQAGEMIKTNDKIYNVYQLFINGKKYYITNALRDFLVNNNYILQA